MKYRVLLALVFTPFVSSCDSGSIDLIVTLVTDLTPGPSFATIRTEVMPGGGAPIELSVNPDEPFREGVRVAELSGLSPGNLFVRVSALDAEGAMVLTRLVSITLERTWSERITLTSRCIDITCPQAGDAPEATECARGQCVSPECSEARPDLCPEPECVTDTDCGADAGCTSAICLQGECFSVPNDEACGVDERCDVLLGCIQPEVEPVDAGPTNPDAGVADAGPPDAGPPPPPSCEAPDAECDIVRQDCPGGSACVPMLDGERVRTRCTEVGPGRPGEGCNAERGCQPGLICQGGQCAELCCPGAGVSECSGDRRCEPLPDDFMGLCLAEFCDPFWQSGCSGEACYEDLDRGRTTCGGPGGQPERERCEQAEDCEPGLRCTGRCRRICDRTCEDEAICFRTTRVEGREEGYGACYAHECEPLDQAGCEGSEACYPVAGSTAACATAGDGRRRDECAHFNDCGPRLMCVGGRCLVVCNAEREECEGSELCIALAGGDPRYGVCTP